MTNQGVAFQHISQNKSCMFSTPQRSTICNHPSGCRTISQRRLLHQRWESYHNQNSNIFVNHFANKGDISDENIQQSLPLGEFERMTKEHINEYGPVQAYNNTLNKRVMIDRMERVATDRILGQPLMDVINNNENENEAHFNSLVDHNYSRQQAENLCYKDLNRFNPVSYTNCQNNNNYQRLEQSRFIGTTHNFTSAKPAIGKQNNRRSVPSFTANREIKSTLVQQSSLLRSALKDVMTNNTAAFNEDKNANICSQRQQHKVKPFIKEPPKSERFDDDVVQIINPSRNIAMNSYTKVGENQQDVNSNKSLTEKSSSCFKLDLSQKNRQITVSKRDQCFMVKPCGIQNIIVSPRKNRNVPVNLTATGVNDRDGVLNFTDNCHCEFQQWKHTTSRQSPEAERNLSCHEFQQSIDTTLRQCPEDEINLSCHESQQSIDTTLRQCPEDEINLSCHEFQQPIHKNCRQCSAAEINMNLPDSRLEKSHCNNGVNTIVPCGNVVHNRQYIDCKIGQEKIQNINSECLQKSQKYCCKSQREFTNNVTRQNVEEQICSLDKENSFEGSKFLQVLSDILKTVLSQSHKNTDITSRKKREKISSNDIISTENCIQDCGHSVQLVKSTANCSINSIVSSEINEENFSQSEVRLSNGRIESSSSTLVLEYSNVPKKMDKDKNLDETIKVSEKCLLEETTSMTINSLSKGQAEKKENYVSRSVTAKNNADKTMENINVYTLPSESTENNAHAPLSKSTEKIYVPLLSESTENNVRALLSESTEKINVASLPSESTESMNVDPLLSESTKSIVNALQRETTENNIHALLSESTENINVASLQSESTKEFHVVPLLSESTENNVDAHLSKSIENINVNPLLNESTEIMNVDPLLSESTEIINVDPLLSESTENNVHALLSESTEKIYVPLPSESTENMNVDPLLSESTESNGIYALPSTSNLPQTTDTTENGKLPNEKQLESVNGVQNENTKKMDLFNDTGPSLLLTGNRKIENIKRNVSRRGKRQSKTDNQLMVEAMQFLCRGKSIANCKNMKIDCFMEEPILTRQKSSAKKCIENRIVKKLGRTSYVEKLKGKQRQDEFPTNSQKKKDFLNKNGTKCDDDTSGRNGNDSGTDMSGKNGNNYDNRNDTGFEINMNQSIINNTQDTEKSFGEPLCCTQTETESELKTLNNIHVTDQIVNANGEETCSDTSYETYKMLEATTSDRDEVGLINSIYSSKEIDVLEPYENEIHQNHYFEDTNEKQIDTLLQEVQNELHSGNQTKNEEHIPSSVSADVTSIKDNFVTNASLIKEKSSGVMKVQNMTSCLSVDQDADTSPIVRKPCWKTDNSSGKWPIPILDRLNLDLSKGKEMVTMSSEKLCVNQPDIVHKDNSASISPQSEANSFDVYEWNSGVDTVVQDSSNEVRGVVIDVTPSTAKKLRKRKTLKSSYLSQGGDVSVPLTRNKAKQLQKESKIKQQKTDVNVTSKKDELAKECSENRNDEVVEKNCSQIEEKKSDSSSTNGTSGESKKRALKRKQNDKEGNKSKEKVHTICNSSNESMKLDSGDQLYLDKSKILEKTISEINIENDTVTMATKKTPKRKLEFDKDTDYLEINIGEHMKCQNIIGKEFKRSCSTNNTGDSIEIVQSKQIAKRKFHPDNETGEPKVNKTEVSDVKLSKSETDGVDKRNQVISKSKKKTKSKRNAEDVIEPISCDQIDKSCSRSSESQLNRKGRKIQTSSKKNSKLIINSSTKSGKKKLETKLKSMKKMSRQKMTKSSMATNTSNNGKVQFRLVTEPADQKIVKLKTEALKKFCAVKTCGYCHMTVPIRHSINHVQIHHPYRCAKCRLLFSTKEEKSRHRRETHITEGYHCITCDKLFYMKRCYEKHVASSVHKKARDIYRRAVDIMKSYLGLGVEPACHGMAMLTDGSSSTAVESVNSHNAIIPTGQVDSLFSNLEGVSLSQHEPEVEKLLKDFSDVKSCMLSYNAANFSLPLYDMQNNQSAFYSCNSVSEQMSQTYIYTANTKCTDDNAQLPVDADVSHSMNFPMMTQNSQDISFISQNPLAIENDSASSSILNLDESFSGYIKNTDDWSEFSAVSSSLEAGQSVTSPTKRLISDAFQLLESDGYYDNDHFKSVDLDGNVDLYDIDILKDLLEMTDKQLADLKVDFSNV